MSFEVHTSDDSTSTQFDPSVEISTRYPLIASPPFSGIDQPTVIELSDFAVRDTEGVAGTVEGTELTEDDAELDPSGVTATTRN
jgi:hypothetical protein